MADTFKLIKKISRLAEGKEKLRLMEVCGTHTVAIFRSGIRQILPENIELVSGPGCPVCVTNDYYIDKAISYSLRKNFIVATFGDMLKVPGSRTSLAAVQAEGAKLHYEEVGESGPEHKKVFVMKAMIGEKVIGQGEGPSKKAAEQEAAYKGLLLLAKEKEDVS